MKNIFFCKKGMTLVEVLVAMGLIGVVSFSALVFVNQSVVFSRRVNLKYASINIAQQQIDTVRTQSFDLIPLAQETSVRVDDRGNVDPEGAYLRSTEVTTEYQGNPYLTKVGVKVLRAAVGFGVSEGSPELEEEKVILETLISDVPGA